VKNLGRDPSYTEWLTIGRIIALDFELQKYDAAMLAGEELSGHMLRARLAAEKGRPRLVRGAHTISELTFALMPGWDYRLIQVNSINTAWIFDKRNDPLTTA
jgi:hypothetical protein